MVLSGVTTPRRPGRWVHGRERQHEPGETAAPAVPGRVRCDRPFVADSRIFDPFIDHWGDRSQLFSNRQDGAVDALTTQYRGEAYDFWDDDVLFAYLNIPGGDALDRVELPGWAAGDDQAEYVFDVVRAEAGVGRGYPEILQQADANAVLDTGAKTGSLALVQEFADEHDLPIEWDAKALSKERRRR